jgi:hypothetical protein
MKELSHGRINFFAKGKRSYIIENDFQQLFYRLQNSIDGSATSPLPCVTVENFSDVSNQIARLSNTVYQMATIYFLCS